jgi:SAM-dependent methyltransferase
VASVVLIGGAVWHVAEAFELRRRLGLIPALPAPSGTGLDTVGAKVDVLTPPGVEVDDGTRAAAAEDMEATGLDVVDLIPADLPAETAIRVLRRVNPNRLGHERLYAPGGASEAVVIRPSLAEKMAHVPAEAADRGAMLDLTISAQRYAPEAAATRVAPGLMAGMRTPLDRWRELEVLTRFGMPYVHLAPVFAGVELAHVLALAAGVAVAPVPGAVALTAWSLKPAIVFGGGTGTGSLRPPGVGAASLLRLPRAALAGATTALAGRREVQAERARRGDRIEPVAPPEDERYEARRDTCPWCGAASLETVLEMGDKYQQKPGVFHLDRCTACRHVFQNPRLTPAGLDYYYDQFYDGVGEGLSYMMFAGLERNDIQRVDAIAAVTEPTSWLDVGTGHGHLCARAHDRWPSARVDGLDMGVSVEDAQRRGAVDHAYRGTFEELAPQLPHRYDVVSMHHYLEHTREPRRELDNATAVLAPGGLLMVEVPDPESPWADHLRSWYWQWSQPEHQHFVPCANMITELESRGYEIVSVERGPATLSGELLAAVVLAIQTLSRSPHLPWLPRATPVQRIVRAAVVTAAIPALVAAVVADRIKDANPSPDSIGNAYRVVARRPLD